MINLPPELLGEFSDETTEPSPLDINLIRFKVPAHPSKKLCEMIVCDRYLGFNEEISVICMEELAKRRENGDDFNFEEYIENSLKTLPILNFNNGMDIRAIMAQAMKIKR